ncbi:MAG: type III pantothenate kinase [Candidatus Omnitrophica bacterium]|nr:type III pantothenate kinase [Candidatus Omnitrophota bacterium]
MLLLADIGNTNISFAVVKAKKITKKFLVRTPTGCDPDELKKLSREIYRYSGMIEKIVVVSVVPRALTELLRIFRRTFRGVPVAVVGKGIKVPIKNCYKKRSEVGQDRLLTSFAALCRVKPPIVVIDFGTAVTMDYVNEKKEYHGGFIFPGLRLSLNSLVRNTALLPMIDLRLTKGFLGKSTAESINNGIIYGYAAFCDGLIAMFREKYGRSLNIVATGGDAAIIAKYSKYVQKVYPDLIFDGLINILEKV